MAFRHFNRSIRQPILPRLGNAGKNGSVDSKISLLSLREFDPTIRRGLLLTYVGDQTNDIFDILPDTGTTYESAVEALTQHFDPLQNKDIAIFEFRELKQEVNETLNEFYRRLKTKASDCNFHNVDDEIRTHIIHKTKDKRLRRRALRESFTLQQLLTHGTSLEHTDEQAKKLEGESSVTPELPLNALHYKSDQSRFRDDQSHFSGRHNDGLRNDRRKKRPPRRPKQPARVCRNCGGRFPHKGGMRSCPAQGTECHRCHKFNRIKAQNAHFRLTPSEVKIHAYGAEQPLDIAGQFTGTISTTSGKSTEATFYVSTSKSRCLLGLASSTALDLLSVNLNNVTVQHDDPQVHAILTKHCKLFSGTGNLKNTQVKLEID